MVIVGLAQSLVAQSPVLPQVLGCAREWICWCEHAEVDNAALAHIIAFSFECLKGTGRHSNLVYIRLACGTKGRTGYAASGFGCSNRILQLHVVHAGGLGECVAVMILSG